MSCDDVKPLLNSWFDNEIDTERRAGVDAHIETCTSCASDVEQLGKVRHAIRDEMRYYRARPALRDEVLLALRGADYLERGTRSRNWWAWGAIAATAAFIALAAASIFIIERDRGQLVAEQFVSAHERALIGRSMDVVSSDNHTVKPWFNGKIPFSPPVIDLRSKGFPLEGGRVDYAGDQPIAALVYSRRLHRIDVFVFPSTGRRTPPSHFEQNGYNEISWKKSDFLFTAVSDLNRAELESFSHLLQAQ
jgi:anti-sigma factor RsiW